MKYSELLSLADFINASLTEPSSKPQLKLMKIYEKIKHYFDAYNTSLEEIRLDHASVDDRGNVIIKDGGGYFFTKDGLKALREDIKKLNDSEIQNFAPVNIVNPAGLEVYHFLKNFVVGVEFTPVEEETI